MACQKFTVSAGSSLALALSVCMFLFASTGIMNGMVRVGGTTYYVSNNRGKDDNTGTSASSPWKTLAKVSRIALEPGDKILLHRGEVWKRQMLVPQGSGTPEHPILIASYGSGTPPHIAPGLGIQPYAIYLENNGGYKIQDLELSDSYGGIVSYSNGTYGHRYLWIDHVYFHDITTQYGGKIPRFQLHEGAGVSLAGFGNGNSPIFSDITITHSTFLRCDTGIDGTPSGKSTTGMWRNLNINDSTFTDSYMTGGIVLYFIDGGVTRHVIVKRAGYKVGKSWGTAAFQILGSKDYTVVDSEFLDTERPNASPDGEGIDFESDDRNITVRNNVIARNSGPAMLINGNNPAWRGQNASLLIENNRIYDNNMTKPYGNEVFHVWKHYLDKGIYFENAGIVRNNIIRLQNNTQTYDTSPLIFALSNTVYNANGRKIFGGFHKDISISSSAFSYRGSWSSEKGCSAIARISSGVEATYKATFQGRQAALYASTGPDLGIASISVDNGDAHLIDLYSNKVKCSQMIYLTPMMKSGQNTIQIRATGEKNQWSSGYLITGRKLDVGSTKNVH